MRTLALLLAFLTTATPSALAAPNILFLVADDQRPDTIAALGNPHIRTPHLDRLVRTGMAFTRAVCAYPLCVPSRAEILTGATGLRNGVFPPQGTQLDRTLATLPRTLRAAGYRTWYVGKWHTTGRPSTHGYDECDGLFSSGGGPAPPGVDGQGREITGYRGWVFQTDDRRLFPEKGIGLTPAISEAFADAAIRFLQRKPDRPFFLHVNFTAPHDPLLMPPGHEGMYDATALPLPPNYLPEHPFDHGNLRGRDELLLPWPRTPELVRRELALYYAVLTHLDTQVGRILDALEASGQAANTVVVYTADHGLAIGSHGLRGKQNMYDHTVGVPLVVRGPGVPRDRRTAAQVYLRDLFPTFCDLAGTAVPATVDGKSFLPVLAGKADTFHPQVFCYFMDVQRMVRDDRWKLIHYPKIRRYQLFDLANDPHERKDLAQEASHAGRRDALRRQLEAWQRQVGDPLAGS